MQGEWTAGWASRRRLGVAVAVVMVAGTAALGRAATSGGRMELTLQWACERAWNGLATALPEALRGRPGAAGEAGSAASGRRDGGGDAEAWPPHPSAGATDGQGAAVADSAVEELDPDPDPGPDPEDLAQGSASGDSGPELGSADDGRLDGEGSCADLEWADDDSPADSEPPLGRARIQWLIDQLKDDHVVGNACRALEELGSHLQEAEGQLQTALTSADHQQRQAAANLLQMNPRARMTDLLLRASVDALRDDCLPFPPGPIQWEDKPGAPRTRGLDVGNATRSFEWLLQRPARVRAAERYLAPLLTGEDVQGCFRAAVILVVHGREPWRSRAVTVLVPHLEDNGVGQDGVMATWALGHLPARYAPALREYLPMVDPQGEILIRHILACIAGDDAPEAMRAPWELLRELFEADPMARSRYWLHPEFPSTWTPAKALPTLDALPVARD